MALRSIKERDPRLDESSFSAVQRAEVFRAQYDHPLIIPPTLGLSLYHEPIIRKEFGIRTDDRLSLADYVKNMKDIEVHEVGPDVIWDQEVESVIRQVVARTLSSVNLIDLYNCLIGSAGFMEYRLFKMSTTPIRVLEDDPKSKRRVYSL